MCEHARPRAFSSSPPGTKLPPPQPPLPPPQMPQSSPTKKAPPLAPPKSQTQPPPPTPGHSGNSPPKSALAQACQSDPHRAEGIVHMRGLTLLVGEGNFSFAAAFCKKSPSPKHLLATSLDTEHDVLSKYPDSKDFLDTLKAAGSGVWHGVDATQLAKEPRLYQAPDKPHKFHCIRWNFPHNDKPQHSHLPGSKELREESIKDHQELLSGFFNSAKPFLAPGGTVLLVLKCASPYSDWDVLRQAAQAGYYLEGACPFSHEAWPGYHHRRTQPGSTNKADTGISGCFFFQLPQNPAEQQRVRDSLPSDPSSWERLVEMASSKISLKIEYQGGGGEPFRCRMSIPFLRMFWETTKGHTSKKAAEQETAMIAVQQLKQEAAKTSAVVFFAITKEINSTGLTTSSATQIIHGFAKAMGRPKSSWGCVNVPQQFGQEGCTVTLLDKDWHGWAMTKKEAKLKASTLALRSLKSAESIKLAVSPPSAAYMQGLGSI
eukprot:TRINITY_DN39308_c0_g2_i1.p1 TRINITY_DN39308_c0_g2~~TRINITY_DN39308_c0_g2_i1.p1  ORF type:complete len:489 (+),score=31.21 TRINITY_DN39308_c0_g2_i1:3-1469(+)